MVAFTKRELLTPAWMRALSTQDAAAAQSDRADHGPRGAWDGWVGLTAQVRQRDTWVVGVHIHVC